jgi:hypothetical protein
METVLGKPLTEVSITAGEIVPPAGVLLSITSTALRSGAFIKSRLLRVKVYLVAVPAVMADFLKAFSVLLTEVRATKD